MSDPLVSIVTTCFNHEPYLEDYCRSLLAQTYTRVELIVLDDGSTDRSWEVLKRFEPQLANVFERVILRRERRGGMFRRAAQGLRMASGELLCVLESDDFYYPEKLRENVDFLAAHGDTGAVHSDTDYLYQDRVERTHWATAGRRIPQGRIFEDLLEDNFIMTCSLCCRTALAREHVRVQEYERAGYLMFDYPMCLDLAHVAPIGYLDRPLAVYRVLPEPASHSTDPRQTFRFWFSTRHIQWEYRERYGREPDRARGVRAECFPTFFERAYEEGWWHPQVPMVAKWLRTAEPARYGSWSHRARALSLRWRWLWRAVRRMERTHLVYWVKSRWGHRKG